MCTITAVPKARLTTLTWAADPLLLRLVCNRDELRTRAAAFPPVLQTVEDLFLRYAKLTGHGVLYKSRLNN